MLAGELHSLNGGGFELGLLGFDAPELEALMFDPAFEPGTEDDQGKLDAQTSCKCPECGCIFDPVEHKI